MGILIPLAIILFTCLIIWRACDGFEVASEYVGRNLSEGVRGGTINAISSSLPELFTTLIALFVLSNQNGFAVGIGTTAGSALFNGMIIPAACIFAVVGNIVLGVKVTAVNVSVKVIIRDGLSLIFCELVLIFLIKGTTLFWWQGLILMLLYVSYVVYMLTSMKAAPDNGEQETEDDAPTEFPRSLLGSIFYWASLGPLLDLESLFIGEQQRKLIAEEKWNGWPLLLASAACIGAACWLLVIGCEWLGTGPGNSHLSYSLFGYEFSGIGMPTIFVAVIFASMATSVPDTVMSIRDAVDGDYDDAVANALGSNIFDICFALGFPLFLYTSIYGPITMPASVAEQSGELILVLLILTVIGFFIYIFGPRIEIASGTKCVQMTRRKALSLIMLYLLFVAYIIGLSMDLSWATTISETLRGVLRFMPTIG
jgi:cation:H+ antiporter